MTTMLTGLIACTLAAPPVEVPKVPKWWVTKTAQLESSNNDKAVGDFVNGVPRSRGLYQVQKSPWIAFGGKQPWEKWAHDPAESRRVAGRILVACKRHVERHGRKVNFASVRWIYRAGGY